MAGQQPGVPFSSGFTCADGSMLGWQFFCNGVPDCPVDGIYTHIYGKKFVQHLVVHIQVN